MVEAESEGNGDSEKLKMEPVACPLCGTAMQEPPVASGNSDGSGVSKCPGCGEEYPNAFLHQEFMSDVTAKFRLEGKGELGGLDDSAAPGVERRPLQEGAGLTVAGSPEGLLSDRALRPGLTASAPLGGSSELNPRKTGLPGDEVHMGRRPAPAEGTLMMSRMPERPEGLAPQPGIAGPRPVLQGETADDDDGDLPKKARPPVGRL
jgi:hypothetical protein